MKNLLITGGAGFIGVNAAAHFLSRGCRATLIDNLSRPGSRENLRWLSSRGRPFKFVKADTSRDPAVLCREARGKDCVLHFAAQVAVTTSVTDPRLDFRSNALGTFNVLEAVRRNAPRALFIYSSTNKVYGGMTEIKIIRKKNRYCYRDYPDGISEKQNLDFHSPYGCSKGCADQYVRDYSRIYGLRSVVFRQSCIYGYRQFGVEDQGWVAWFALAAIFNKPVTIYGDGRQVRDLLFITDLISAYESAVNSPCAAGRIYNIGGGPRNTLSLLELVRMLEKRLRKKIKVRFADWRPGDQPVYISSIRKAEKELHWRPRVSPPEGVERLVQWINENKAIFFKGRRA